MSSGLLENVRSIPVRPEGRRVPLCAFAPFQCALGVVGVLSAHSRAPWRLYGALRPEGRRVRSCAFGPFTCTLGVVGFVRVRSVLSHAPSGPTGRQVRSCAFGPFPFFPGVRSVHSRAHWGSPGKLECVRSIPMLPGCRKLCSGRLPCALWVVVLVRVRSVNSRAPCGSSGSFVSVRSVPLRPVCRRVRLCAFGPFPSTLGMVVLFGCVQSIPVRPAGRRVLSCAFGPFLCTLGVIGCVRSIHVHPWGRRLRSIAFGQFPGVVGFVGVSSMAPFRVVGFVRVRSVHSRASWVSSG